jgi:hypothetical protein
VSLKIFEVNLHFIEMMLQRLRIVNSGHTFAVTAVPRLRMRIVSSGHTFAVTAVTAAAA